MADITEMDHRAITYTDRQLDGVRGFLLLLVFLMAIVSAWALLGIASFLNPPYSVMHLLAGLAAAATGASGFTAIRRLLQKNPRAPRFAAGWLLLVIGCTLALSLYRYLLAGSVSTLALPVLVHNAVWLAYLARSKRVKATYGRLAGDRS